VHGHRKILAQLPSPIPFLHRRKRRGETEYAKNRGLAPGPTPASPSPVCDPCAASASQTATLELALFTDTNLIALVKYFPASIRYSGACPNPGQMQRYQANQQKTEL